MKCPNLIFAEVNQTIHVASLALHSNKRHRSKFNDKHSSLFQNIGAMPELTQGLYNKTNYCCYYLCGFTLMCLSQPVKSEKNYYNHKSFKIQAPRQFDHYVALLYRYIPTRPYLQLYDHC